MLSKVKYLRSLPYLLVIFLAIMWWQSNNNASYEKSQREFWTQQYETSRISFNNLQKKYNSSLKELREKDTTVVEVITKPDGTIIKREERTEERTETREEQREEVASEERTEETLKEDSSGSVVVDERREARSAYSVTVAHPVATSFDYSRMRFDVGARIGRSPFSAVVGSDGEFSNVYLGVRFEW